MAMASTGSSSSVDENFVEEVTQGTSMTTREELADDDIQDDDGSSCYQVPDFFRIMSKLSNLYNFHERFITLYNCFRKQ